MGLRVDGTIQDRGKEHLGQSDKAISAYRRMLRRAIAAAGSVRTAADGARCASAAAMTARAIDASARARLQDYGRRPTPTAARRRAGEQALEHVPII